MGHQVVPPLPISILSTFIGAFINNGMATYDSGPASTSTQDGMIYFGTTTASAEEALDTLSDKGMPIDALRVRGFPFNSGVLGTDWNLKLCSGCILLKF